MSEESNEIKKEPPESNDEQTPEQSVVDIGYRMSQNEQLLSIALQRLKDSNGRYIKPTSSPAQEAAKARIRVCELHLRALYKKQAGPDREDNDLEKIRKVEEDLRKAHARLKRLTNEAQRQRRRRERLRMGLPPSSPSVLGVSKEIKFLPNESSDPSSNITTSSDHLMPRAKDRAIMGALRKCGNFKDLARELFTQGYTLCQSADICGNMQVESSTSPDENIQDIEIAEDNPAAVLEQSMSFEEDENNNINDRETPIQQAEIVEIKSELTLDDASADEDNTQDVTQESNAADIECPTQNSQAATNEKHTSNSRNDSQAQQNVTDMVRIFAETYAVRHASQIREWQEQYQVWFQRQLESQQQWQEVFMREQIEHTRSMVENVTTTFLQEMQQMLQNVITSVSNRPMVPFIPNISRNAECLFSVIPTSSQTI